jgi:hypothetical protein
MESSSFHDWTCCGRFFRHTLEERKGPKGGRRTAVRASCVVCGGKGPWVCTKRPGSYTDELAVSRDELRTFRCPDAQAPSRETRMLLALATAITAREAISFPFAVEFLGPGQSLEKAALEAWDACTDGHAMAMLVVAQSRRVGSRRSDSAQRYEDGRVHVSLQLGQLHMSLGGPEKDVAEVLRSCITGATVEKLAALAEKKAQVA